MFEKIKRIFKKSKKSEENFIKAGSKKNEESIKSSSANEMTDDSLGNVAGGQRRPDPRDIQ